MTNRLAQIFESGRPTPETPIDFYIPKDVLIAALTENIQSVTQKIAEGVLDRDGLLELNRKLKACRDFMRTVQDDEVFVSLHVPTEEDDEALSDEPPESPTGEFLN